MDAAADRELRELRARAYGPYADIASDPVAQLRLQELESSRSSAQAARASRKPVAEDRAAAAESHPGTDVDDASADPHADEDSFWEGEDPLAEGAGEAGFLTRWRGLLWVASVVASAALAAAVTYTLASIPAVSASADAPQIATLELTRTGAVPPGWFGAEEDVAAAEFYGLTIYETPGWVSESGDRSSENRCLNILRSEDLPTDEEWDPDGISQGGVMSAGCSIAAFPATVEMPIDGNTPDELIEKYPSGTALQFVLDGDRVGVFLDRGKD
ncbi:hypothetical protein [Microbacterium sp.]|uniref:hypothetical protein n=1 Tax=Microbacterium sp. TaxID=51671 RepID=UPI0035690C4D